MSHVVSIEVGVVLARETLDNAWQDHRWRAVAVLLDAPPVEDWREHVRDGDTVFWHAATLPLQLHRKETAAYKINLETGEPAIWIVLRENPGGSGRPVEVHLVSASPHEVQAYGEMEQERVESVPMPEPLIALLQDFIARHHREEPFIKRQRDKHHREEDHKFGNQPIFARGVRRPPGQGGDGHA